MKKFDKVEISSLLFLIACVIPLTINIGKDFGEHFYYIREHLFIIALLLFLRDTSLSSFSILLKYGIIIYKIELIIYNIILIPIPEEKEDIMNTSYDVAMILTGSIFLITFTCKYFDQICKISNKILRWISR